MPVRADVGSGAELGLLGTIFKVLCFILARRSV